MMGTENFKLSTFSDRTKKYRKKQIKSEAGVYGMGEYIYKEIP